MYLGDPRESLVSLKDHATWEADNRVEERWQWGAQILDLCDLSPEDYKNSTAVTVKTIQDCGECGGGGKEKEDNEGKATINQNELSIEFKQPIASTMYASVTFMDSDFEEFSFITSIPSGSDGIVYDLSSISPDAPYSIADIKIGFEEDGSDADYTAEDKKYKYSISFDSEDVTGKTYAICILCTKTDSLTAEDYLNIIQAHGEGFDYVSSFNEIKFEDEEAADATFSIPCSHVDSYMPEDVEEEYFIGHSHDFVILTEEKISEIKEDFTVDTDNWTKGSPVTINNLTFNKWTRRDLSGAQCPYVIGDEPCDGYDLTYELIIKK